MPLDLFICLFVAAHCLKKCFVGFALEIRSIFSALFYRKITNWNYVKAHYVFTCFSCINHKNERGRDGSNPLINYS